MRASLSNKKMLIAGVQGTGKTYLAKNIARHYKTVVYSPHTYEWKNENVLLWESEDYKRELGFFCTYIKEQGQKYELVIFDEADLLFNSNFDTVPEIKDMVVNHRHPPYRKAIIFATRRMQDIPTRFYGTCEYLALFANESPQVRQLLNKYNDGLGDMVASIPFGSHQFVLKKIGERPRLMKAGP